MSKKNILELKYSTVQYNNNNYVCVCTTYLTTIICMLRKPNHGGETLSIDSCIHIVQCTVERDVTVVFDGSVGLEEP